ncbi:hypothetical protein M2262_004908 [Pseudomonas sp. BIGb0408]|uniref:Uncharacterized protein n=1 Tax=Phytopseudomonas flavescens TaxID=29435 RepID=A0A7Y9XR25_9GAMM|nr:hypothetical protein [Pseudomonas sp. BIGb0408]NYH75868.1 hypothetical protein [Pseudomonas flavescens]
MNKPRSSLLTVLSIFAITAYVGMFLDARGNPA